MANSWETEFFGSLGCDAACDADGDGLNNQGEFIAGTNPTNSESCFKVNTGKAVDGSAFVLTWDSVTGRVYSVYWKDCLGKSFQPLETGIQYPQNSYTDTVHSAEGCGYYQVDVELDPSAPVQP